jgi:hypothetical protein
MQSPPLWQELSRIAGWPLRAPGRRQAPGALAREDRTAWSDTLPEARFLDEAPDGAPTECLVPAPLPTRRALTL